MTENIEPRPIIIALGQLLTFAAWADGEIQSDEYEVIKDLIFSLPDIHEEEWACILMHLELPTESDDINGFLASLNQLLQSQEQRDYAVHALRKVIEADGVVTIEEEKAFQSLEAAIQKRKFTEQTLAALKELMGNARSKREAQTSSTLDKEKDISNFINNPVFFKLAKQLKPEQQTIEFNVHQLQNLSLAGAIMAHIAQADNHIHDDEVAIIVESLSETWLLGDDEALLVASVALNKEYGKLDMLRICRHFYEHTDIEERLSLLQILVAIAEADGEYHPTELDAIATIAEHLKIHDETLNEILGSELEPIA